MTFFAAAMATLAMAALAGSPAMAQAPDTYDPAQLPSIRGKVAEYSLSPRGDVDGLILDDNTEVHLPPHLGAQLVSAVKPGDAVTIHGLRAKALPMVLAMSITNDATGRAVTNTGPGAPDGLAGPSGPGVPGQDQTAQGMIRAQLHGPRGELNGALLGDGTIVRLPPAEAQRLSGQLTPGTMLAVQGPGVSGRLGHVIDADRIGPNLGQLIPVAVPRHPPGAPPPPP